jgi:hypothetical protein
VPEGAELAGVPTGTSSVRSTKSIGSAGSLPKSQMVMATATA